MPSVTLASVMTSMMCSTYTMREVFGQSDEKATHSFEVLLPSGEVREVLILELTAECLCPEYYASHPPLFRFPTWG